MTIKAVYGDGERRRLPLSERVLDQNLSSYGQVPGPHERPRSATADTEVCESLSADRAQDHHDDHAGHAHGEDQAARRNRHLPHHGDEHDAELADVAWLYAWSHAGLRSSPRVPGRASHRGILTRLGTRRG